MAQVYSKGSSLPPLQPGKLRLYTMDSCPFCERAVLTLEAKGVQYEPLHVDLQNKPEWLYEKNPAGTVPILEFDGKVVTDSLTICDYLDEAYPGTHLHSSDAYEKARDKMVLERFGKLPPRVGGLLMKFITAEEAAGDINSTLSMMEKELASRKTDFFCGAKPGMLDLMIWPFFERLMPLSTFHSGKGLMFPSEELPCLKAWTERMLKDEVVSEVTTTPDTYLNYLNRK